MKKIRIYKIVTLLILLFGINNRVSGQTLEEYLQVAAENNPRVKGAYAQFEAAMQQAPQVSSLPDPTLTMSAFGRMIETRLGAQEARFSLMQMFPWFGTLQARENASVLMAEASFQQYLDERNRVFLEVKSVYAELYALREMIEIQNENLGILDSYRELALSGFRSGSSPMVNVVRVDIRREALLTEIELLRERLSPMETRFNLMLNRSPGLEVKVADTLVFQSNLNIKDRTDLGNHPTLSRIEKQKQSYEVQQTVAEKEGMPMIGLGVDYSIISKRTDANPEMNGRDAIMPMVSVSLPIFRKKYRAAKKEAAFMVESMEAEQQAQLNELQEQYEMNLFELNKAGRLVELYDRQVRSSTQANSLLISAFSSATGNFEEVLGMNQDILMLQNQKIEAIRDGFIARANLEYILSKTE